MGMAIANRALKFREIETALRKHGFVQQASKSGSHKKFKKAGERLHVTVAGKPNDGAPKGTISSILRQSGLKKNVYLAVVFVKNGSLRFRRLRNPRMKSRA